MAIDATSEFETPKSKRKNGKKKEWGRGSKVLIVAAGEQLKPSENLSTKKPMFCEERCARAWLV